MLTEKQARQGAEELVKKLGAGWKADVFENLGWHYHAYKGPLSVSPGYCGEKQYSCLLTDDMKHAGCGSILWTDNKSFKDPVKAVEHTIAKAKAVVQKLDDIVHLAKNALMPVLLFIVLLAGPAYAANVTDGTGNQRPGTTGQILVNDNNSHRGLWTDVNDVPEIQAINDKNDDQDADIADLQTTTGQQTTDINALQTQQSTNTSSISSLNTTVNSHTSQIQDINTSVNKVNLVNARQDQDIAATNTRVDDTNNRVAELEQTQVIVGLEGRVYDGKKWQVNTFIDGNTTRNKIDRVGVKFTYKFGKSYEERRLDELQARLDKLEGIKQVQEQETAAEVYYTNKGFGIRSKF